MAAYSYLSGARAGLVYGLNTEIETKIVGSGVTVDFGDPVFVDEAVEDTGYLGDSTDSSLKFLGVAIISQRSFVTSEGEYPAYDAMNVLTEGEVWVPVASGVTACANKAAYAVNVTTADDYNKFGISTTSGIYATAVGYFRSNPNSESLALVQLSSGLK